ncbi:hypothetical protein GTO89_07285 [Heliobacterium gestii]|uniref:Uncharacterized protein n=1 Tax=Heliomicrobium gestii TaxID=2699 RepID=A0A845LB92_HELGE|nr:ATP-binding protein [Heliomicrobium gestii]MBM7866374.1 anti-sigma regulatory factor (Ser/Thr protein kinase) [Heliomicrobium gestii]MZP42841.1 hypothetical protein [Heliomicrobium gestii]
MKAWLDLIDGGNLRRKLEKPLAIEMLDIRTEERFFGDVVIISPTGLGIRSDAPWKQGYRVRLSANLDVIVRGIFGRELDGVRGYDIVEVLRDGIVGQRLSNEEYALLVGEPEQFIDMVCQYMPESVQGAVRGRLLERLEKLQLIDELAVGQIWAYGESGLRSLGRGQLSLPYDFLVCGMQAALADGAAKRDFLAQEGRYYDLHFLPLSPRRGGVVALDITEVVRKERFGRDYERKVYRDVILAATQGRLVLLEEPEMRLLKDEGVLLAEGEVCNPADVRKARSEIKKVLCETVAKMAEQGKTEVGHVTDSPSDTVAAAGRAPVWSDRKVNLFLLCCMEALTNAVKHAGQGGFELRWAQEEKAEPVGMVTAAASDAGTVPCQEKGSPARWHGALRFWVADQGPGIPLEEIPKATLMDRYSTKGSLGSGFYIMLQGLGLYSSAKETPECDGDAKGRLLLHTGVGGTVVGQEWKTIPLHHPPFPSYSYY